MKKLLIGILIFLSLFSEYTVLNAVGDETDIVLNEYNPADYDPGVPEEWFLEDGSFGE